MEMSKPPQSAAEKQAVVDMKLSVRFLMITVMAV